MSKIAKWFMVVIILTSVIPVHHVVVASTGTPLSDLTISSGTLSPAFDPEIASYTATVENEVSTLTVTPTTVDPTAAITVNGAHGNSGSESQPIPLAVGFNAIEIKVTAGGAERIYTVFVTRLEGTNAKLKGLSVTSGTLTPAFEADVGEYSLYVPNSVTSMSVTATADDAMATIRMNGKAEASGAASAPINLDIGANRIEVVVTAEDFTTKKTYVITVTRASALNGVVVQASAGNHTAVVKNDGTVWTWGRNDAGQLGNGSWNENGVMRVPAQVPGIGNIAYVAVGALHTLGLTSDGTVWSWGSNYSGELGIGSDEERMLRPVQVTGLTEVVAVDSEVGYGRYSLALKSDGTVWSWGDNEYGQLGDGTTTDRSAPIQVEGLSNIISVAAGQQHGMALRDDGTVWAWGRNVYGEIGDGTTTQRLTPVQVPGLTGVKSIDAGAGFSIALKNTGTLWAWGYNGHGQLGDGSMTSRIVPAQVHGKQDIGYLTRVTKVAAGTSYAIAQTVDGAVWTWGSNQDGQLGHSFSRTTPNDIPVDGVIKFAGGWGHAVAIKTDGTLWAWGSGALGDEKYSNYKQNPVQVTTNIQGVFSHEASLESLTLSAGNLEPAFSPHVTSYKVSVGSEVKTVRITTSATDAAASIQVNQEEIGYGGTSDEIPIPFGDSKIIITVTAEDGTNQYYSVDVTRDSISLQDAIESIHRLPAQLSLEDMEAVEEARTKVTTALALGATEADISNFQVLVAAEATMAALIQEASEMASAIEAAEAAITALPESIGLGDVASVQAAREAVKAAKAKGATDEEIANLSVLAAAEATLAQLQTDKTSAIEAAEAAIAALPESIGLGDAASVEAAREAVDAAKSKGATDEDIANLSALDEAESVIARLQAEKALAIEAAEAAITALPESIGLGDSAWIEAAREAIDAAKAKGATDADIVNLGVLESAEAVLAGLKAEKAAAVEAAIDAIAKLPDPVGLADKHAIDAARTAVDAAKAKGAVDAEIANLSALEAAEAKLLELGAVLVARIGLHAGPLEADWNRGAMVEAARGAFSRLNVVLKKSPDDVGILISGVFLWEKNGQGDIEVQVDATTGQPFATLRIAGLDPAYTLVIVGGLSYLEQSAPVTLRQGGMTAIDATIVLRPGDFAPEGKAARLNNLDFSAWLQLRNTVRIGGEGSEAALAAGDITLDGVVDAADYELWLSMYKKAGTGGFR